MKKLFLIFNLIICATSAMDTKDKVDKTSVDEELKLKNEQLEDQIRALKVVTARLATETRNSFVSLLSHLKAPGREDAEANFLKSIESISKISLNLSLQLLDENSSDGVFDDSSLEKD